MAPKRLLWLVATWLLLTLHGAAFAGQPSTINCSHSLDAAGRLAKTIADLGPGAVDHKNASNMELNGAVMAVDRDGNCIGVKRPADAKLVQKLERISEPNGGEDRTIYYVNGVLTDTGRHCRALREIGQATCAKVIGIYNATNGWHRDYGECLADTKNVWRNEMRRSWGYSTEYIGDNPAVKRLAKLMMARLRSGKSVDVWAHSQGGLITSLALSHARNTLAAAGRAGEILRVRVTSFASASPWWPDGPTYRHFIHTNDMVPVNLGLGRKGNYENAGSGARIYRFNGDPGEFVALPDGKWASIPYPTSYHDVLNIYLRYYKKLFGDCDGGRSPHEPIRVSRGATGGW